METGLDTPLGAMLLQEEDGAVTGFAGGLDKKAALLAREE